MRAHSIRVNGSLIKLYKNFFELPFLIVIQHFDCRLHYQMPTIVGTKQNAAPFFVKYTKQFFVLTNFKRC